MIGPRALEIVAAGLRTPGGSGWVAAAMNARANRFWPRATMPLIPTGGRPLRVGLVDGVPPDLQGLHRLVSIAVPALWEVVADLGAGATGGRGLPVWLALPARGPGYEDPRLDHDVLDVLARTSGVRIDLASSGVVRSGRAGGAELFERTMALWSAGGPAPALAVVGGIDSAWSSSQLDALVRARAGARLPMLLSEGAAFLALAPYPSAARPGATGPRVICTGAGSWRPPADVSPADVDFVAARVELLRRALGGRPTTWTLPDADDDGDRAIEWWRVVRGAGLGAAVEDQLAERVGDVGAAFGPTAAAVASSWWRAGVGRGALAAISLASDHGPCGAIAIETAG